jgi:hypothetical protein
MRVFLSVASSDRPKAEEVAYALRDEGHKVFLDEQDLPPGESYHRKIRLAIEDADLFVFFVSPASVKAERYTLTELLIAQKRWPHPRGRVLPVLLSPIDLSSIPPYLRAVSVLKVR